MATLNRNFSGNWKAVIRKKGWSTAIRTFRTKKDAQDWARRTEDEMVRGVYIDRAPSERMTLRAAIDRYLNEVAQAKGNSAISREKNRAKIILKALGEYSLAAITPQLIADYRDHHLTTPSPRTNKPLSGNTVRLELALLSHLFTVAIQEWGIGLTHNPVALVRKPKLPRARDQRITKKEESILLTECAKHSNPMLHWIVVLAIETGMRKIEIVSLKKEQVFLRVPPVNTIVPYYWSFITIAVMPQYANNDDEVHRRRETQQYCPTPAVQQFGARVDLCSMTSEFCRYGNN